MSLGKRGQEAVGQSPGWMGKWEEAEVPRRACGGFGLGHGLRPDYFFLPLGLAFGPDISPAANRACKFPLTVALQRGSTGGGAQTPGSGVRLYHCLTWGRWTSLSLSFSICTETVDERMVPPSFIGQTAAPLNPGDMW